MEGIVIDTNVFVAALFNPKSIAARILQAIREEHVQLIWDQPTKRETEVIVRRIPRLEWLMIADLFRPEWEFRGLTDPGAFTMIADPDDRKFAALSAAAKVPLVTNDNLVLDHRGRIGIEIATPRDFLARLRGREC